MGLIRANGQAIIPPRDDSGFTVVGKDLNGAVYIEIRGKSVARATYSPGQAFDVASKIMEILGYRLEAPRPPG